MPEVRFTPRAHDLLTDLEEDVRERVKNDLRAASENPERELSPLTGHPYFAVRTGEFRSLIDWDRDADVFWVFAVGHRRKVFDRYLPP